jgi:predicted RNase H-like nuclease (RuvC/YqgF family)
MPPQPKRPLESASQELASQDNCVNTPENKNEERIAALEEQLIASNKQISSLKTENLTLKEDVRALQRFTSSFSRCQLCNKAFKRSDGLRKHLRKVTPIIEGFSRSIIRRNARSVGENLRIVVPITDT